MDDYIVVSGRKLKKGYTTGSCAAAAAKAAVYMLLTGETISEAEIDTPAAKRIKLKIHDIEALSGCISCSVIKDGGDDIDITHGAKIFAKAVFSDFAGIQVKAGTGIGTVTKKGLKVSVGKPAINPVPMSMIIKEVSEVLESYKELTRRIGVEITLSVLDGEELAKKTYNPRLGIIGGISILGTTGIVMPMSTDALMESLALGLSQLEAYGKKSACMVFGSIGAQFAEKKLSISGENIVTMSNFVGFMLRTAAEKNFENIVLAGHIGKLAKVAAGNFQTHSSISDGRAEVLCTYAALSGAGKNVIEDIYHCTTTEEAAIIIKNNSLEGIYKMIANKAAQKAGQHTYCKLNVSCVLFDNTGQILAMSDNYYETVRELRNDYTE